MYYGEREGLTTVAGTAECRKTIQPHRIYLPWVDHAPELTSRGSCDVVACPLHHSIYYRRLTNMRIQRTFRYLHVTTETDPPFPVLVGVVWFARLKPTLCYCFSWVGWDLEITYRRLSGGWSNYRATFNCAKDRLWAISVERIPVRLWRHFTGNERKYIETGSWEMTSN